MRKIGKTILTICVVLFFVLAVGLTAVNFGIKLVDRSGWSRVQSGAVYYLDWEGDPQTGWKVLGGKTYYFDPDYQGIMATDWLDIDGRRYYFDDNGIMMTGWLDLEGTRYFLNEDGTMVSGWQTIDENLYYFDEAGAMAVGWLELEGKRFYMGVDGKAYFGWLDTTQGRCYLPTDGSKVAGWQEIDGKRYFFHDDGCLVYGWLAHDNEYYYLDDQGVMVTGWLELTPGWYYLSEDGSLQTGWLDLPEGRYFLGTDGIRDTGWVSVGSSRYYLGSNGLLQTGWLEQEGARYYLGDDGAMAVGQVTIDGTNCFFTSQGKYVVLVNWENPVPEGYEPELVSIEEYQIDKRCLEPLEQLLADCTAAGYTYSLNSVYRSLEDQQDIWDTQYAQYLDEGFTEEEALALVAKSVALPGTSEHHLGLAVDLGGDEAMYQWLRENSWKYGFIVRYPDGKTDYTGIIHEPWHIRYVGPELAQELYELDLCMEEYMEMLTK